MLMNSFRPLIVSFSVSSLLVIAESVSCAVVSLDFACFLNRSLVPQWRPLSFLIVLSRPYLGTPFIVPHRRERMLLTYATSQTVEAAHNCCEAKKRNERDESRRRAIFPGFLGVSREFRNSDRIEIVSVHNIFNIRTYTHTQPAWHWHTHTHTHRQTSTHSDR